MEEYRERFTHFTLAVDSIGKNIQRVKNDRMAAFGLRGVHVMCLCALRSEPGAWTSALARRCEVDRAMMSRVLNELTESGLVTASEGSRPKWALTQRGLTVTEQVEGLIEDAVAKISNAISTEELRTFYRVLDTLNENIEALAAGSRADVE